VLVYPPGLDFLIAFVSCLKAGIVAVPVFPPHPARGDTIRGFAGIVEGSGATKALTSGSYKHAKKLGDMKNKLGKFKKGSSSPWPENLEWIVTDGDLSKSDGDEDGSPPPSPGPSDPAFLQYTSGSTSAPKGVIITHGNLAHNLRIITSELSAHADDTVVVSWLPQYHDMGLIGSYLGVLYCGGRGYYMSPLTFLARPMGWVEAISEFGGTHLQAPNFAFKLTARKFDAGSYSAGKGGKQSLDLSSVRHIINGAEPCSTSSMDAFLDAFAPYGLRRDVMFPTYGLAEHTVFVCSGGTGRLKVQKRELEEERKVVAVAGDGDDNDNEDGAAGTTTLIGCGFPSRQNVDVRIVDPETRVQLPDDSVGEIWVRSPSKAAGYFGMEEKSREEFRARLKSKEEGEDDDENDAGEEDPSTGYLRTGDLGFLHSSASAGETETELYVCGRSKDLLIIGGRNFYPQDVESTAEDSCSSELRPGCSAAFSVDSEKGGEEVVAYVAELREVPSKKDADTICKPIAEKIRAAVQKEHSLALTHVCLLKTRTVPKTTSGKISRSRCRKGYLDGTLEVVYKRSFQGAAESPMSPLEIDGGGDAKNGAAAAAASPTKKLSKSEAAAIRSLPKSEIVKRITADVARLANAPSPSDVDKKAPLVAILDSLALSQFKGMLEGNYGLTKPLSDEYLFRESTTIEKLAEVVKLGYAPDDDGGSGGGGAEGGAGGGGAAHAQPAGGGGVAQQALGCPPGVCCVVM